LCCADERQALLWLLRQDTILPSGRVDPHAKPITRLPAMRGGTYRYVAWDNLAGCPLLDWKHEHASGRMQLDSPPFRNDLAIGVSRLGA
jgi:hypothetical protein